MDAKRSCSPHAQSAVDRRGDLVRFPVDLVLREPVHPPAVVDQPRVATGIAEYTFGEGVVGTLVLDADAVLGIGQVEPDGSSAPVVQNGVLRLRAWKAAEYEDQPQPGLHRGSGACVGEVNGSGQCPAPPCAGVPLRERQHAVRWETADAGECVESDDGLDRNFEDDPPAQWLRCRGTRSASREPRAVVPWTRSGGCRAPMPYRGVSGKYGCEMTRSAAHVDQNRAGGHLTRPARPAARSPLPPGSAPRPAAG